MNIIVQIGTINFRMYAGRRYMYLNFTSFEGTKKFHIFTLHKTPWGIVIYQEWVSHFYPKMLVKLTILVGCILKMLPLEYRLVEGVITARMGKILGKYLNNHKLRDL
jgi:hypothetical protein